MNGETYLRCVFFTSSRVRKAIRTAISFSRRTLIYIYPIKVHFNH